MLGGWVIVTTQNPEELNLASNRELREAAHLATWEAGVYGTAWVHKLVETGKAQEHNLNGGYPNRYTALARDVLPLLADGIPKHASPAMIVEDDTTGGSILLPENYTGKVTLHRDRIAACPPDRALTVEVWDQS